MSKKDKKNSSSINNPFSVLKGLPVSTPQKVPDQKPEATAAPTASAPPPKAVDEDEQFASAMGQLGVDRGEQNEVLERPAPSQIEGGTQEVDRETAQTDHLSGVGRRQVRKAARRMGEPEATLDLHGVAVANAVRKVEWFLENAIFHGFLVVRIVTGKGVHSEFGPVVRPQVEAYLSGRGRQFVVEWIYAPKNRGGEGALLIELHLPVDVD
jgi:DNA-nicking Smr family endonuclease